MKYVMLIDKEGRHVPILFPDSLVHLHVAEVISRRVVRGGKVLSAGFASVGEVQTAGRSESLDVEGRELDAGYIMGGDAVAYMPEPIVGNLLAGMRKRRKPRALVRLASELGPEPVPTHGGLAFVVHWKLSIEGVLLAQESIRRHWIDHLKQREVYTQIEHAPSGMKFLFEELSEKFEAPEET